MINKSSPMPLYLQIAHSIREMVLEGKYPVNSQVPTEEEIAKQYGVSRMTARNAVTQLVNEGLVYRVHGKGAFVSATRLERNLNRLSGFYEDMVELGLQPSAKVLSLNKRSPNQKEQHALSLRPNQSVFELTRIRYLNHTPVGVQTAIIPERILPNLEELDVHHQSLYLHMRKYGIKLASAEQRMEAVSSPEIAAHLGLPDTAPFFFFERITYDDEKRPIELLYSHFRGDMYTFSVTLYG